MEKLTILDTIVNLKPIPSNKLTLLESEYQSLQQLPIGQVGTIVEIYEGTSPSYLVEFADLQGREYAMAIVQAHEILAVHYELDMAS
ncbi:MAG: DUF4926 domain-containing protein [Symploca sp. SIO1B1]|nr:DUF4926 domain-containing protein [Symploca sp. SIO1C2]NER99673.1 DUF4926 domain-containing protein [Symploca sp. SIO1B1]